MGSLSNGKLCNGVSDKRPFEESYSLSSVTPKFKKRKVSAVRVFPPGCGPNAPKIKANHVDGEKRTEDPDFDTGNTSEIGDGVKSPSELELFGSLDDLVGKVVASASGTVNGDDVASSIKPLGDDFWQTLQIDAPEFSHDFDKVKSPAAVKIENAVETKLEVEIINEISLAKGSPIGDGDAVKGPNVETRYPRRRVSATREFPPFCGRNAVCPTEEERAKLTLGASYKAPQRCEEILEKEKIKKEEPEADLKDESHKIEDLEVKNETLHADVQGGQSMEIPRDEVDATQFNDRSWSGCEESYKEVREKDSPKSKQEVHKPELLSKAKTVNNKKEYKDERDIKSNVNMEMVVFADKSVDNSNLDDYALGSDDDKTMVQSLISGPSSSQNYDHNHIKKEKKEVNSSKMSLLGNIVVRKKESIAQEEEDKGDNMIVRSSKKRPPTKMAAKKKLLVSREQDEVFPVGLKAKEVELTLPPFGPSSSSDGSMRNNVRETLRLFQAICRKILQGEEANLKQQGKKRIDLDAAKIIKGKGKEVNTSKQIIGTVPGVEVGDEFLYRVELALVGVHRLYQAGIDYMMHNGMIVCASIVASGGYADELDNPDILIYSGQGGMPAGKKKEAEDQKLERGNLAMKNSIATKNPVRVIRGTKDKVSRGDARAKMAPSYAYDGLYTVEKYWQEVGHNGKLVFKFELRRIPGQPELAWKEVKKSKKFKSREGVCVEDISNGKEVFRICAVNTVNNEAPPAFSYVTKVIYPSWYKPTSPEGCGCIDGCSDSRKCSCVVKNGEEIPYNHNGAIVEAKPLVHECGPACKCPPSCYNRVTQYGMKIQLEIFKTDSRGWGVRSLSSIPSGSFICEYIGELLEDKEAEQRRNDEYLFDIGKNYTDCSHQMYSESSLVETDEDSGFTIDAAVYGNVGRFINHSCSPNLYAQNVLYDHEDRSMPHIMLFAAENIPPLQELTYHYNYSVGQVRDSNGNVKVKNCYCGSEECEGRMY